MHSYIDSDSLFVCQNCCSEGVICPAAIRLVTRHARQEVQQQTHISFMDIHEVFMMKKSDSADLTYFAAAGKV